MIINLFLLKKIIIFTMLFLLTACQAVQWQAVAPYSRQTAMANDGSGVAVLMLNYETNRAAQQDSGHILGASRHFEQQIFVQNQDGSQRRAVTEKRPYKDELGTFHYVASEGYFLLGSVVSHNGQSRVKYEKIDAHTGQARLIRYQSDTAQPLLCYGKSSQAFVIENVLPSPSGEWIAYFYSPDCFKVKVEFLDAHTLQLIDIQEFSIDGIYQATWQTPNHRLTFTPVRDEQLPVWQLEPKKP
jgi:hypothetical protein